MKQRKMYFLLAILIVITLAVAFLLNSCATALPTDVYGNTIITNPTSMPVPFGKEMILIGQHEDIQVFKIVDSITEVTCYVTINSQRYQPSSIFCIK